MTNKETKQITGSIDNVYRNLKDIVSSINDEIKEVYGDKPVSYNNNHVIYKLRQTIKVKGEDNIDVYFTYVAIKYPEIRDLANIETKVSYESGVDGHTTSTNVSKEFLELMDKLGFFIRSDKEEELGDPMSYIAAKGRSDYTGKIIPLDFKYIYTIIRSFLY